MENEEIKDEEVLDENITPEEPTTPEVPEEPNEDEDIEEDETEEEEEEEQEEPVVERRKTIVKDIFEIAMSLADSLNTTGQSVIGDNKEYEYRTPALINLLQAELIDKGKIFVTIDVPYEKVGEWVEVEIPEDLEEITRVLIYNNNKYYESVSYSLPQGLKGKLRVKSSRNGIIKIEYRPVPILVSSIEDEVSLSHNLARAILPYGLVAYLFLEENPTLANTCLQRYQENVLTMTSSIAPNVYQDVEDVYGVIY